MKTPEAFDQFRDDALTAGFGAAGAVNFDPSSPTFLSHTKKYQDWISQGRALAMTYLERGLERRLDPRLVFPETKSVWVVLFPYSSQPLGSEISEVGARYASYMRGGDYHLVMSEKLEGVMSQLKGKNSNLSWKVCVDTSAVLERSWGDLTGLGWIGKNKMLIHPQLGSNTLIGVVLTNIEFDQAPKRVPNYCGSCTRCIEACPTDAISENESFDTSSCIAYWTIEKRSDPENPFYAKMRELNLNTIAGCDICQDVCPFNTKAKKAELLVSADEDSDFRHSWDELIGESLEDYRLRTKGKALDRVKPRDFERNLISILPDQYLNKLRERDVHVENQVIKESRLTEG